MYKYLLKILNQNIRGNKFLTKLLFGVKVEKFGRIFWDFTTIALRNCLKEIAKCESEILEIGTGPYAILSIFLFNKYKCKITACDINKEYIIKAQETIKRNCANINLIESDLFANVSGIYDIIFFNSVYIPENKGKSSGISKLHKYKSDWCGGEDGADIIDKYLLSAKNFLSKSGYIVLGYNPRYLRDEIVLELCKNYNYKIVSTYKYFLNPSKVILLI